MLNEKREIAEYHIQNKLLMDIERNINNTNEVINGFPIYFSEKFIFTTVIVDFHDEGYTILRTKDIIDVYSHESDTFLEQICINEGLQNKIQQNIVNDISSLNKILLQLKNYNGFICVQCEEQAEKCAFYMGRISEVKEDSLIFHSIDMYGKWDENTDSIPLDEITQISFGDNYSTVFYKYVTE